MIQSKRMAQSYVWRLHALTEKIAIWICFYAPLPFWKKGPVGRSVCRPSHVCSISFDPPFLESCQSWYNGCPYRVDDPFDFEVRGQSQTAGLWKNVVHSISLDTFAWKWPNLMPLGSRWPQLMFRSHGQSLRQGQTAGLP